MSRRRASRNTIQPFNERKAMNTAEPSPSPSPVSALDPETGISVPRIERPGAGIWRDPLGRYLPISGLLLLLLGAVLQGVDTWLVKQAMDVLIDDTQMMSFLIATAIGLGSFVAAVGTGMAIRAQHRAWATVGLVSWAALGLTVMCIRWEMSAITRDGLTTPGSDHALAALMLALFVAAGIMVMYDMQKIYNRARGQARASGWRIAYLNRRLAALEPLANRLRREVALRTLRVEAIEHRFFNRKADNAEFAAELRDLARLEILRQLGDENESGLVYAPHRSRTQPQISR
jgi:hypothetical protein